MRSSTHSVRVSVSLLVTGLAGAAIGSPDAQVMLGAGTIGPDVEGTQAWSLIQVGDFNKDGFTDLLYKNSGTQELMAMMGDATGSRMQYGPVQMDFTIESIVAAQLDLDSEPELVVRDRIWGYMIKQGIDEPVIDINDTDIDYSGSLFDSGLFSPVVRAGDLDQDGLDELIFNTSDDRLIIRRGDTGGRFSVQVSGLGELNSLFEPADYDGDGDIDLLLFSQDSQHFILVEGSGSLSTGVVREIMREYPSAANDERPVFAQLDSNPAMDMVVSDRSGQSFRIEYNFLLNSFSSDEIETDEVAIPLHVAGDLDGSGEPDLIALRLGIYPIIVGSPEYFPAIIYDFATDSPTVGDLIVGQPRRSDPYSNNGSFDYQPTPVVTTLDADADGDEDLLWYGYGSGAGESAWFVENRAGVAGVPAIGMPSYDIPGGMLYVLPLDIDDDGLDEFVLAGDQNLRILDLQDGTLGRVNASSNSFMVAAPDLDGDGVPELVNASRSSQLLRIFTKQSNGTYGGQVMVDVQDRGPFDGLEVADFNNDGLDDLVAMEFGGPVSVFLGGVGPSLTFSVDLDVVEPSGVKPGVLDYDGDGLMDIAAGSNEVSGVQLFRNEGNGTFSEGPLVEIDFEFGSPYWITTGDIDLDGNTDLVVTDNVYEVAIVLLDGAGNPEYTEINVLQNPVEAVIEDFDADGRPDIAIAGTDAGTILPSAYVIPQVGHRRFGRPIRMPAYGSQGVATSDVNLDGIADLVAISDREEMLRVYYGSPSTACPADLNGDGELNFFDVSEFLVILPDYNGDAMFNFFDVAAFLSDYQAGCP